MASAPSAKRKKGLQKLLPCYIGITNHKDDKGKKFTSTHYVLINDRVATRLGLATATKKPGGSDASEFGIVYKKNRKRPKGGPLVEAKRFLKQYKKKITLYCKGTVKNSAGKDVQESYTIGFPSGVPLALIRVFLQKNCPNVIRYGTGSELYQVR
jgi:hypothetical protein